MLSDEQWNNALADHLAGFETEVTRRRRNDAACCLRADRAEMQQRMAGLEGAIHLAVEELRDGEWHKVEWRFANVGMCPVCGELESRGHAETCSVGNALRLLTDVTREE